ncbi:MAG TPA: FecR domain-containing protein [Candidatus Ozemobacteraceae bacterium]|nr:FecR domain-containing protein [Candidatus Ozemobacteraceae bacterium]
MHRRFDSPLVGAALALVLAWAVPASGQVIPGGEWRVATSTGSITTSASGTVLLAGDRLETGTDGQTRISGPGSSQVRLREDTRLRHPDEHAWEVTSGLAGFRFDDASDTAPIHVLITPFARAECRSGLYVVKVASHVVRIAVLRGSADITGPGDTRRTLGKKEECAATESALSSPYTTTDDLYFAWYWDK